MGDALLLFNISRPQRLTELSNVTQMASRTLAGNSRSITHLANYPSPSLPMISSDESKESTTCLLGYGLGDVNVLTALDWSKNVYEKEHGDYPHEVIQIVRTKAPRSSP